MKRSIPRRDGLPLREAVELAGRMRLRPILMTSIATALGLVPMSLGIGEGSELEEGIAWLWKRSKEAATTS